MTFYVVTKFPSKYDTIGKVKSMVSIRTNALFQAIFVCNKRISVSFIALAIVLFGAPLAHAQSNANLSNLTFSSGSLSPSFSANTVYYTASVGPATTSITVTPTVADATSTVTVNGVPVTSGNASGAIALAVGSNTISTSVTSTDLTNKVYTLTVSRPAAPAVIPTLSEWALILFGLILVGGAALHLQRRQMAA